MHTVSSCNLEVGMREALKKLINDTLVLEYELPDAEKGLVKTIYSAQNDQCFSTSEDTNIADIVYNAIPS